VGEHSLESVGALGTGEPRADAVGAIRIAENPGVALASVAARRGRGAEMAAAAETLLASPMPPVGGRTGAGPVRAFWTGPDRWMFEAPFATHELLAEAVKAALGDTASVTEQTDAWVRFDVEGATVPEVFERLCPLDIGAMAADTVARTTIGHLGCYVLCRHDGAAFSVLGPRSAATSLHHALVSAAGPIAAFS
jgi:sarcosine oxidase subunit gamma